MSNLLLGGERRLGMPLLDLRRRSPAIRLGLVLLGTLGLTLCSWIEVPLVPVPVNMQTFGITMVGALFGWRFGAATVVAWLGEAALGLPVLSGGAGGLAHFFGPTAGYLASFPFVAALVGWLTERGWTGHRVGLSFAAMLAGNALCLAVGASWLAVLIGPAQALAFGVTPFLLGGLLKSALAAALMMALDRGRFRRR